MAKRLTGKQELFIAHYVTNGFNATEAARSAGYKGTENAWAVIGSKNIRKANIREAITKLMAELAMPPEEVLARLALQAEGKIPTRKIIGPQGMSVTFDTRAALELIGKHFALFTERIELSGEVEIKGYLNVSPDDWPGHEDQT